MAVKSYFQFIVLVLFPVISEAGGWVSGGGELIRDAKNPWFLNNTHQVKFCIISDETNFGVTREVEKEQILKAFSFWKKEFKYAVVQPSRLGIVTLADQELLEVSCETDPDITFQFGLLTSEQERFLKRPQDFAAVTVRTEYDEKNLRGKGFVYFSPEQGPLAFKLDGKEQVHPWSVADYSILYSALVHELGHVYGLSHTGDVGNLMSERFVEGLFQMVKSSSGKIIVETDHFFSLYKKSPDICPGPYFSQKDLMDTWGKIFDLAGSDRCVRLEFKYDDSVNELFDDGQLEVWAGDPDFENGMRKMMVVELKSVGFFYSSSNLIWLTEKQDLFVSDMLIPGMLSPAVIGPSFMKFIKKGMILSPGKTSRPIRFVFEQGKSSVSVETIGDDGEILSLL